MLSSVALRNPFFCFQVNSSGQFGTHKIEGYGILEIPKYPGYYELEVDTWKPVPGLKLRIANFYLGGMTGGIRDLKDLAKTYMRYGNSLAPNNMLNVKGEFSGKIVVRLNVVVQS